LRTWTSRTGVLFSVFSMVTEVGDILRVLSLFVIFAVKFRQPVVIPAISLCLGQEVALWVKENFKKELVKL